jgi:hypothetical protein
MPGWPGCSCCDLWPPWHVAIRSRWHGTVPGSPPIRRRATCRRRRPPSPAPEEGFALRIRRRPLARDRPDARSCSQGYAKLRTRGAGLPVPDWASPTSEKRTSSRCSSRSSTVRHTHSSADHHGAGFVGAASGHPDAAPRTRRGLLHTRPCRAPLALVASGGLVETHGGYQTWKHQAHRDIGLGSLLWDNDAAPGASARTKRVRAGPRTTAQLLLRSSCFHAPGRRNVTTW